VSSVEEISPEQLRERLASDASPVVLDVREPWELEIARLPATLDIPMAEVPDRLEEVDRTRAVVVLCRSGARSRTVGQFLLAQGYASVANLTGGILAWRERIDPSLRPY
jgi:sulfur-carrier protein adenylyltransferase/sulfurtransferase